MAVRPGLLLILTAFAGAAAAQQEPAGIDYRESVQVDLAQIEVTAWPKQAGDDVDPAVCQGLTSEDFEIVVNGRRREIAAVDWLGSAEMMQAIEGQPIADPAEPPLTIVLFFDLWHLNLFYRSFDCPITKPLAFEEARRLVREELRPGDRLLLVTFAGWPKIHSGWIRDPDQALRALDRLEVDPFVLNARQMHSHHQEWIDGVKSLLLALGRYPGRKEVFYLGDDFRFDDLSLQLFDLAARAQVNQVSMHAVDLLAGCRGLPGPGCPGMDRGGLGCTPFRLPIALGYLSTNTGGALFKAGPQLTTAVRRVREMRGCRYLISFPIRRADGRRSPKATVRTTRKDLRLHYPSSFGSPAREPTERERQDALFLLPRFSRGLQAEVGLWPLRPTGKRKRWRGVMVARLSATEDEAWSDGVERIEITAVAHRRSKIYGKFGKILSGTELETFRESGTPRLFVFPLEGILPGSNTVSLRAQGVGSEVSVNVRGMLEVPEPPGPGESGPWFLMDRLGRAGESVTMLPALDGVLPEGKPALLVGFGCRGEAAEPPPGRLIHLDADLQREVPIHWLEAADSERLEEDCGWLTGRVDEDLPPGLWRFEPPGFKDVARRDGEQGAAVVEFRIAETD